MPVITLGKPATWRQPLPGWSVLVSEGNAWRSLDAALVVFAILDDGDWFPATTVDEIQGILAYRLTAGEPELATAITGAAEINDACIDFGTLDRSQAIARARELGIIVREAINLPNADS